MSNKAHDAAVATTAVPGRRLAVVGGLILLVLGLFLIGIAIAASTSKGVEGIDLGRAIAPFAFAFSVPPLITAVAILRSHRTAQVLGIIVGLGYGTLLLAVGIRGDSPIPIAGLGFLGAAILLLDSFRRGASR